MMMITVSYQQKTVFILSILRW